MHCIASADVADGLLTIARREDAHASHEAVLACGSCQSQPGRPDVSPMHSALSKTVNRLGPAGVVAAATEARAR